MLKIDSMRTVSGGRTLRLEGRLIGPWVAEFRGACERALAAGGAVIVDLSEVAFADREGLKLLSALDRRGVTLECSPFVAEQLKARPCR
jgi:anti-anti-sigma regulatory factor